MIESDSTPAEWLLADADARGVLEIAADSVAFAREGERLRVRSVLAYAALHPASGDDAAQWGDLDGSGCDEPVAREGAPGVAKAPVADLAAALQITTAAGYYLLDACLELKFRLPGIHRRFEELAVDFARVRQVTTLTQGLGAEAAAYVDRRLAPKIHRVGRKAVEAAVAMAIVRFHPELADEKARRGKERWGVEVRHPAHVDFASTSDLEAAADSLDLEDFLAAVSMTAEDLARDGDTDSHPQRMAKALGLIGRAMTGRAEHPSPDQLPEPGSEKPDRLPATSALSRVPQPRSPRRRGRHGFTVHAHLETDTHTDQTSTVYHLPGLGAVGEEVLARWVATHGASFTRVIDLDQRGAVDRHDPPGWMRAQVQERDGHCVFPGCEVPATGCDLDHIEAYQEGGPPGQTSPENLACLCRMHHLLKTHEGWRYRRRRDGSYLWTSPTGSTHHVEHDETRWNLHLTSA